MKVLAQTIIFVFMSYSSYSQELSGDWNGALNVQGTQLRLVFHVTKTKDQYDATLDTPDQNTKGIQVTATTFSYPKVKFEISNLGAVYEGTMAGKDITGKWVQGGTALFLLLEKKEDSPANTK